MRAYLAGPEVFFADRFGIGAAKARIWAYHPDGMSIEDFGLADNLMLIEAIRASGGRFHSPASGALAPDDLSIFKACVAGAAPSRYAAAG